MMAGTGYYIEDEQIDFNQVLHEEKIPLPEPANWTAHWLAVLQFLATQKENNLNWSNEFCCENCNCTTHT
jgi:hypothetical protein